eukprot:scaffold566_cov364-Pavlova_lutheri.AAC.7
MGILPHRFGHVVRILRPWFGFRWFVVVHGCMPCRGAPRRMRSFPRAREGTRSGTARGSVRVQRTSCDRKGSRRIRPVDASTTVRRTDGDDDRPRFFSPSDARALRARTNKKGWFHSSAGSLQEVSEHVGGGHDPHGIVPGIHQVHAMHVAVDHPPHDVFDRVVALARDGDQRFFTALLGEVFGHRHGQAIEQRLGRQSSEIVLADVGHQSSAHLVHHRESGQLQLLHLPEGFDGGRVRAHDRNRALRHAGRVHRGARDPSQAVPIRVQELHQVRLGEHADGHALAVQEDRPVVGHAVAQAVQEELHQLPEAGVLHLRLVDEATVPAPGGHVVQGLGQEARSDVVVRVGQFSSVFLLPLLDGLRQGHQQRAHVHDADVHHVVLDVPRMFLRDAFRHRVTVRTQGVEVRTDDQRRREDLLLRQVLERLFHGHRALQHQQALRRRVLVPDHVLHGGGLQEILHFLHPLLSLSRVERIPRGGGDGRNGAVERWWLRGGETTGPRVVLLSPFPFPLSPPLGTGGRTGKGPGYIPRTVGTRKGEKVGSPREGGGGVGSPEAPNRGEGFPGKGRTPPRTGPRDTPPPFTRLYTHTQTNTNTREEEEDTSVPNRCSEPLGEGMRRGCSGRGNRVRDGSRPTVDARAPTSTRPSRGRRLRWPVERGPRSAGKRARCLDRCTARGALRRPPDTRPPPTYEAGGACSPVPPNPWPNR